MDLFLFPPIDICLSLSQNHIVLINRAFQQILKIGSIKSSNCFFFSRLFLHYYIHFRIYSISNKRDYVDSIDKFLESRHLKNIIFNAGKDLPVYLLYIFTFVHQCLFFSVQVLPTFFFITKLLCFDAIINGIDILILVFNGLLLLQSNTVDFFWY